ncbi:hypothetical protein [uncultured Microbacterium sp.]|uniref:hypothetical protein n=1 Tax=Microbacterium algeriense TaxID=2615184 RepID=UPI0025939AE0|nr:hypothetical protein [uncultured Microbacterium sp.]
MTYTRRAKLHLALATSFLLISTVVGGPAHASITPQDEFDLPRLTTANSQDIPSEYLVYPDGTPLPLGAEVYTDEEMAMLEATATVRVPASNIGMEARTAEIVGSCHFSVGNLWKRSSAKSLPHGGIGAKPSISSCWGAVSKTFIRSYVYMHNGWIWVPVTKAFESYGTWNMEQKSVLYPCNGTGEHTFRVVSYFKASGAKDVVAAEAQLSSGDYKFKCG